MSAGAEGPAGGSGPATGGDGDRGGPGRWGRLAVRVYRWAVRLLPPGFRRRFGEEALRDFRAVVTRKEAAEGRIAVVKALVGGIADVVGRAPRERMRERGNRRSGPDGWAPTWIRDVETAVRSLLRRPGFSAVAVGTLALGTGANVAIFAVVHGVLLKPLPFPDSERVVSVRHHAPGLGLPVLGQSRGTVRFYRELAGSMEAFAVVKELTRNVEVGQGPERAPVVRATPSFFQVVRTRPVLGRAFSAADAEPGAPVVAVLSHGAWTRRFGADPGVLGRTLRVDDRVVEIVGVMPGGFEFPGPDVLAYVSMHIPPDGTFGSFGLNGLARVADGVTLAEARAGIEALQPRLVGYFPDVTADLLERARWGVTVEPYRDLVVGDVASALWVVLGTVAFVLLIAAANVANLFLVRAEGRQREIAVRAALGAGRGRLASLFLSESLVVGLVAGLVGTMVAWAALQGLVAVGPAELPRLHAVELNGTVLAFGFGVSVAASLALGAVPVVRYLGGSFADLLSQGGRAAPAGRKQRRVRNALAVSQLALALVLLVGSGLMLRTFHELRRVDVGIDAENVLTLRLSMGQVEEPTRAIDFYRRAAEAVRALPDVRGAGVTSVLPLGPSAMNGGSFEIESKPTADDDLPPVAWWGVAGDGVFESLGVPLVSGRMPTRVDGPDGRPVVWVNETFARTFFDGAAVGERVRVGDGDDLWREIVGVVGDVRHMELREEIRPMIYLPLAPDIPFAADLGVLALSVKTRDEPADLVPALRDAVASVDADVPLSAARTMEDVVAYSMAETSFTMTLLAIAAVMALLLASVGVYAVIAYVVSRRTREIGVRMAVGADAGDVRRMVLREGLGVAAVGIALGLAAAFGFTRLMEGILFRVSATDPVTFIGLSVVLAAVAAAASYLPARRATRVDPAEALRAE